MKDTMDLKHVPLSNFDLIELEPNIKITLSNDLGNIVGDLLAILKNKGIDERTLLSKAYRDLEHVLHSKSKQYVNWVKKYLHHNNND